MDQRLTAAWRKPPGEGVGVRLFVGDNLNLEISRGIPWSCVRNETCIIYVQYSLHKTCVMHKTSLHKTEL